jgi:hypothetical protein
MPDPISRLQLAQEEIDRVFGAGYAAAHPDVLVVTVQPRRAIGLRRGWRSPSSAWRRPCWSRTNHRTASCGRMSCSG